MASGKAALEAGTYRIPARKTFGQAGDMQYLSALRYAGRVIRTFTPWDGRPRCGHVLGGANWYGSECANAILVFASVLRYGRYEEGVTGVSPEELADRTIRVIRYICFTHDSGPADCVRVRSRNLHCAGTKWGERAHGFFRQSQCGRSVFALGLGAWLLWERLDEETRRLVQAVVEDYSERFCEDDPRNGTYFDTQCEENGWTSQGLAIGPFLFPDHPRAKVWEEGYKRWAANTAVLPADRRNDPAVSGALAESRRFLVSTLHPDFTTENHAMVHPDYLNAALCLRGPIAILSLATGKPIAEEVLFHTEDIYDRVLKPWALGDGGSLYPQGQDWWYSKMQEFMFSHTLMSVLYGRADAAGYELENARTSALLQDESGSLYPKRWGECPVAPRDYEYVEDMEIFMVPLTVFAFMLHAHAPREEVRPRGMRELLDSQIGTYVYPHGGLAVHRLGRSISTVSWRNHVTASTLPEDGYWTVTPTFVNYVGVVEGERVPVAQVYSKAVHEAVSHRFWDLGNGFGLTARLERLAGRAMQDLAFVSLPTGETVYIESVSAVEDCRAGMYETGIIGVRNESEPALGERAKGYRVLRFDDGASRRYEGRLGGADLVEVFEPPRYLAIDECMAFLLHNSRGVAYINIHDYPKWRGLEDLLVLNSLHDGLDLRQGRAEPALVIVSLPNCGIQAAAERYRTFSVLEGAPEGCQVLLHGDYLAYANFAGRPVSCAARGPASGEIRVFRGSTAVRDGSATWRGDVEQGAAGYLPLLYTIRGDCDGLVADVPATGAGTLSNRSDRSLGVEIRPAGWGEPRRVRLEPGRFVGLE
jgi:hypothetical protein